MQSMKKTNPKSKKIPPSSSPALTSNDDELEFREKRGRNEDMRIEPLQKHHFPFVSYSIQGQTGINYTVEIRSLSNKINSCSCPDFQINTLGTCKHIEGVFHYLKQNKMNGAKIENSPYIEIYLAHGENQISIAWPKKNLLNLKFKTQLESFFSPINTMITDPLSGMASIHQAIFMAPLEWQKKIRISSQLKAWISNLREKEGSQLSKDQLLKDVALGKRSLQILNVPLNPCQEEGMLHFAFKGRAILADETDLGNTLQAIAACELLRRNQNIRRVLVISTAALKDEWRREIKTLTELPTVLVTGNRKERLELYKKEAFFFLAHYEQIRADFAEVQALLSPDVIILDEVQKIKNWETKTASAVKQVKTPYAFILWESFSEKKIEEIYSIMQIVDTSVLGPLFKFNQNFYAYDAKGKPTGHKNLEKLHIKLKPFFLRRLEAVKKLETARA
jgi:SNF2 family DNA or RNA helicase